jgi:hypothetical protein
MSNEVMMKQEGALAEVPMSIEEMEKDTALGGKMTLADIGIPFLYILQSNSPQTNPDSPKYIEGAKAGGGYITVLEKVFDIRTKPLVIVAAFYERLLVEWIDRDSGGGLVASYEVDDPIKDKTHPDEKGRPILPNGHSLQETAYVYALVEVDGTWTQCVIPFKSTALKIMRKWNSQIATTYIPGTQKLAPRWLYTYNFSSAKESKDQYVWSSPVITSGEMVTKTVYNAAKDYAGIAAKGILRRKVMASESKGLDGRTLDDEIPF